MWTGPEVEVKSGGYSPSATTRALASFIFSIHFFSFLSLSGMNHLKFYLHHSRLALACTAGECKDRGRHESFNKI